MLRVRKKTLEGIDIFEIPGDPEGGGIVLFHGFGADANDLMPLSEIYQSTPRPSFFFPNAPYDISIMPGYGGRAWFHLDLQKLREGMMTKNPSLIQEAFPKNLNEIRAWVTQIIRDLEIPFSKLFLGGFSQGAILALDIALHAFEKMGGLLLYSPAYLEHLSWEKLAPLHAGVPFFQSHGENDPLIPFENAKKLEKTLIDSGLKGKLHAFPGGHEIPPSIHQATKRFLKEYLK